LEISFQEQPVVAIDSYLEMAERRSGALMGCASRLGVCAAQIDDRIIGNGLQAFGSYLGLVRHIVGDHALFWGTGERDQIQQGRLQSKKKTLPVVHALTHGGAAMKRRIGEIYMKRILEPTDADYLSELLDEAGSRQFTLDTANQFRSKASQTLIELGLNGSDSGLKSALDELAEVPKS
jgi:geranylgeranyl diphosphate synthase type I